MCGSSRRARFRARPGDRVKTDKRDAERLARLHTRLHETVYVLEGELTMTLGDKVAVLTPGDFASIPPGVVHTFRNDSAQPARALNVNASAGWEHYMRELAAAASAGGLTPALMVEIASRHDFQPA
jgi:mannose-6-phosphate isomerase-like protein (cupin superfamily)